MRIPGLRASRAVRFSLAGLGAALLVAPGCGSTNTKDAAKPEASMLGLEIIGDTTIEKYDLNGDQKPDLFKIYVLRGPRDQPEKRTQLLARQDLDLDFDGDVDVRRFFNEAGTVVREEMDLDFDGQFDAIDFYSDGVLYRRDLALNFDGKPSITKYYTANKLTRKERDTNADGTMDTFEFYENGKLVRIGVDKDGDGKPDVYTEVEGAEG
ncbi:MAG: hypothetical protein JNJ59_26645 [Deltaproteobacteria bacterium]|nr:hypothetical protein [Deltaproteobacteria bacterium]